MVERPKISTAEISNLFMDVCIEMGFAKNVSWAIQETQQGKLGGWGDKFWETLNDFQRIGIIREFVKRRLATNGA